MAEPSYILFHKSLLQCRNLGARGGRAFGRNQRARRALIARLPTPPQAVPLCAKPRETTAEAIALLDARLPWLRWAEKRLAGNQTRASTAPRTATPGNWRQDADGTENALRRGSWIPAKR